MEGISNPVFRTGFRKIPREKISGKIFWKNNF